MTMNETKLPIRDAILQTLRNNQPALAERYGVQSLAVFGSVARNEATETSDVDLLVDVGPQPSAGFPGAWWPTLNSCLAVVCRWSPSEGWTNC